MAFINFCIRKAEPHQYHQGTCQFADATIRLWGSRSSNTLAVWQVGSSLPRALSSNYLWQSRSIPVAAEQQFAGCPLWHPAIFSTSAAAWHQHSNSLSSSMPAAILQQRSTRSAGTLRTFTLSSTQAAQQQSSSNVAPILTFWNALPNNAEEKHRKAHAHPRPKHQNLFNIYYHKIKL